MKKIFLVVLLSVIFISANAQNITCANSTFLCLSGDSIQDFYSANINSGVAEPGPNYGCLYSEPNPMWFKFMVQDSGDINILISSSPQVDIDFICWGIYDSSSTNPCDSLNLTNVIDCSYSTSYNEICNISNADSGQIYILMITNYSNVSTNIVFSQSNSTDINAGSINCLFPPFHISSNSAVCEGDTLKLSAQLSIPNAQFSWTGPNGFSSNLQNPVIPNTTINNSGNYYLSVFDGTTWSYPKGLIVLVNQTPVADFTYSSVSYLVVNFNNTTTDASHFYWNFGDNTGSLIPNPTQTYAQYGTYLVTLDAYNDNCWDFTTKTIAVSGAGISEVDNNTLSIYPNPSSDIYYIKNSQNLQISKYSLFSSQGKLLLEVKPNDELTKIDLSNFNTGIYFIQLFTKNHSHYFKIIKTSDF